MNKMTKPQTKVVRYWINYIGDILLILHVYKY